MQSCIRFVVFSLIVLEMFALSAGEPVNVNFGAILPSTVLITVKRTYNKRLTESVNAVMQKRHEVFNFTQYYRISQAQVVYMPLAPSPTAILENLCEKLLPRGVITILYFTNSEVYGSNAASAQYLLQLIGYLGIPVIAWNTDNVGLEKRAADSRMIQLAPSVDHQAAAILSILRRYNWKKFCVVTSEIGGHDDFIRAIREKVSNTTGAFKYHIIEIYTLKSGKEDEIIKELEPLANSEARVIILFCSKEEAVEVMKAANRLEITGKNYVWIVSQSILGGSLEHTPPEFPAGMLGINFNTTINKLLEAIDTAVAVFAHGIELLVNDASITNVTLQHNVHCDAKRMSSWKEGEIFSRYLRNVSIPGRSGQPNIEFNPDGTLKYVELEIMNLRFKNVWDKIGVWSPTGLDIKDIVWPGGSPVPPRGVPEKFNLKVTFMEEAPYVNKMFPDNETGECTANRAVRCRVAPEASLVGLNMSEAYRNPKYFRCCTGFCIDLLQQFSNDLGFSYDLHQVEDGTWGVLSSNGTWNGLIAELLNHKADIVVTSIKINSERQQAVDFTVPFLETGIAIVVAKRTGIISPKAFLEPFDTLSWLMILLVCIHAAAFIISFFEWLSPGGFGMKINSPTESTFSLCRANWMVWALLFGAAVNVDCPRGFTARFMSNVWGFFSVIFLAIYTANLATFMITREEFYDLTGIEDKLLQNPYLVEPAFRYGTIPYGNTEAVLKSNKPEMYAYMRKYNRSKVLEGIAAVKERELDAFIYDATVLEYRVGQDNDCRLLTVGSWYAMTGYGFALRKKNKYLNMFNRMMIEYRENGDLERLRSFWLQGACKPKQDKRNASHPLSVNQFMSAFLLLGCGVLLTGVLLGIEHIYFRYISKLLFRTDKVGCCTLVSRNIGAHRASLAGLEAVQKPPPVSKGCDNETCELALRIISKELEQAKRQAIHLEQQLQVRCMLEGREMPRRPHLAQIVPAVANERNTLVSEIETAL